MAKILIIEDDPTITEGLADTLQYHDHQVATAATGREGLEEFYKVKPELIILDLMLPDLDGFEVCRRIKKENSKTGIIMLTAKDQESDKLLGFELGADDYVTKPFSIRELTARVSAVLKRSLGETTGEKTQRIGHAKISIKSFTIEKQGVEHRLSPKEVDILTLLLDNPGEVITRDRIIDEVWGDEYFPSPRTIDNFILKLRTKIEDNPREPRYILTVHGAGYKLKQ